MSLGTLQPTRNGTRGYAIIEDNGYEPEKLILDIHRRPFGTRDEAVTYARNLSRWYANHHYGVVAIIDVALA